MFGFGDVDAVVPAGRMGMVDLRTGGQKWMDFA
jgi:hypothetical protein